MSEKTEWPTPERIAELRTQGVTPYSKLSTAAVSAIVVILVAWSERKQIQLSLNDMFMLLGAAGSENSISEQIAAYKALGSKVVEYALVVVCSGALAAVCWRFLQTRGLLYFTAISPDMKRLSHLPRLDLALYKVFSSVIWALILGSIIYVLIPEILRSVLTLLAGVPVTATMSSEMLSQWLMTWCVVHAGQVGMWAGVVLAFLAIVMFLWAKGAFMWHHRMSREEVLRDKASR